MSSLIECAFSAPILVVFHLIVPGLGGIPSFHITTGPVDILADALAVYVALTVLEFVGFLEFFGPGLCSFVKPL